MILVFGLSLLLVFPSQLGIAHSNGPSPSTPVGKASRAADKDRGAPGALLAGPPGPKLFTTHFYGGSLYNGASTTATSMSTYIATPDDVPDSSSFYYVLLSVWDSAGSYDQIGFTDDDGVWGLTYSWTTACAASYNYNPDAMNLQRGTTYDFVMTIGSGTVVFDVYGPGGGLVWHLNAATGGSDFVIASTYTCSSGSYDDYTDYEEVWDSAPQNVPSYDFFFTDNMLNGGPETSWTTFYASAPSTVVVYISSNDITVANQPFSLSFATPRGDWANVSSGTTTYQTKINLTFLASDGTVSLAPLCLSSGWSLSFSPSSGSAATQSTLTVTIPSGAALGTYCVRANATDSTQRYTHILLNVTITSAAGPSLSATPQKTDVNLGVVYKLTDKDCGSTAASCLGIFTLGGGNSWRICTAASPTPSSPIMFSTPGVFNATGTVAEYSGAGCSGSISSNLSSSQIAVTITPLPTPSGSASPSVTDANKTITFTGSASGGVSPYSFAWRFGDGSSASTQSPTHAYASAGAYFVRLWVNDSVGGSANTTVAVTVNPPLSISSFTASPNKLDLGRTTTIAASVVGGTTPLNYTYVGLPGGCLTSNASSISCNSTAVGTFIISVFVNDSVGGTISTSLSLTVYADPTVGTPAGSPGSGGIDAGQLVTYSSTTSGGSGGNTYTWTGLPTGCATSSTLTLNCTPTASGSFSVSLTVIDSSGYSVASGSLSYVVVSDPSLGVPTATPATTDVGQSATISVTVSGGSGGNTYAWKGVPAGCTGAGLSFLCEPTAAGTASITVSVTDSNGYKVTSGALSFTVYSDPTVAAPTVSPGSVDLGQSATISVEASGGSGGYTYAWTGLPAGCAGTTDSFSCTASAAGNSSMTVSVTDSNGYKATSAATAFRAYSDPMAGLPTAKPSSVDVGQGVTFLSTSTGGSGGYTYTWTGLPDGCKSVSSDTVSCTPATKGAFSITVTVKDTNGYSATSSALSYTVDPDPTLTMPAATPPTVEVGQTVALTSTTGGGSGGNTYAWSGLPDGCVSASTLALNCTPAGTGTFNITVSVTDSNGITVTSAVLSFTVSAKPSSTGGILGGSLLFPLLLVVLVVIVVVVVVALWRRSRSKSSAAHSGAASAPPSNAPPPPPPSSPPPPMGP
jgi:hypothetical protein